MVNAWLVIVVVIITLAIIASSIYILVYFSHPEDKNVAWFPKIVVVLGLTLAAFSILMLPLDVANTPTHISGGGGFPMEELWLAVYIIIAAMVVVVIPFAIFYYEAEEVEPGEETPSQLASAIKGTVLTLVVFMALCVVLWFTIGIAEIPVVKFASTLQTTSAPTKPELLNQTLGNASLTTIPNDTLLAEVRPTECVNVTYNYTYFQNFSYIDNGVNITLSNGTYITVNFTNATQVCYYPFSDLRPQYNRTNDQYLKFRVTFLLYIISMVVFLGWVLFIVFGGIGFIALPFDCINDFRKRPIRISLEQYTTRKKDIGERATKLIEIGNALRDKSRRMGRGSRWSRRRQRSNYNKFRQAVFFLEEDYERLQLCYKRQGGKVLLYYLMFLFGLVAVCLTILWVLQIFLFMFTQPYPFHPFLNSMLIAMDQVFALFGVIFYGLFAFYLLLCVIKGNFKFGMRVFILFPIHPMRVGGTLMNAFLFNTLLILICSVSITQFTTQAFSEYTSLTAINAMFSLAVRNLMGIRYIFLGYIYALFCMIFLAGIYFAAKPKEKPATDQIVI
jgi:LMBR1 domain-containing protein 1